MGMFDGASKSIGGGGSGGGGLLNQATGGAVGQTAGGILFGPLGAAYGGYKGLQTGGTGLGGETPGYNPSDVARPGAPGFGSIFNSPGQLGFQYQMSGKTATMDTAPSLVGQFDQRLGGVNINQGAINGMRGEALRTGPSAWLNSEMSRNNAQLGNDLSNTAQSAAGQAAMARSNLAMKHGLSSGAAERIGMQSGRDAMAQQQQLRASNALGNMSLNSQDQQNRLGMLNNLAGQEANYAGFDLNKQLATLGQASKEQTAQNAANQYNTGLRNQATMFDIGNSVQDRTGQNAYNQGMYGQGMNEWAANQQANAIANNKTSGGLLSFLGMG